MVSKYKTHSVIQARQHNGARVKITVEQWHPSYIDENQRQSDQAWKENHIVQTLNTHLRDVRIKKVR